ncbi:biotin-dependent carboxyltransferase family protein [Metabacillus herbersteinensis]|uniref:Biotin-dependent carboxyltransferase family protein n=1 Tax=Metabacillus herbersteinensis TaxID=283816 RepID=A0ABV6GHY6_9BACI
MSMKVIRPGLLTSMQDLGRYGFQKYGVIVSGAMDTMSLRIANLLVGNEEGEAALEITLMGPSLEIEEDSLIAITGGDLSPTIAGEEVPLWRPVYVKKGSVLQFGRCGTGFRSYLAIAGGFVVKEVMGSKSTYLRGGIGGYDGRALKAGDVLPYNKVSQDTSHFYSHFGKEVDDRLLDIAPWGVNLDHFLPLKAKSFIRVIHGGEFDRFTSSSQRQFFEQEFEITPKSDRMGYRLSGKNLQLEQSFELISESVSHGTIQVPQDGNPIILLADRQTAGGYPKIAQIITVDLPRVAQLKPGEKIRFEEVTLEEAEQLYLKQEQQVEELKVGLLFKRK